MSFQHEAPYVDPFAVYTDNNAGTGGGNAASKGSEYWRVKRLHRWSIVMKLVTFVFTLSAFLAVFFAKQTADYGWVIKYKYFTSFQFLLYTNGVVCLHSFVNACIGFVTAPSNGQEMPRSVLTTTFVVNILSSLFLLVAFAAGVATELISRRGWHFTALDNTWQSTSWRLCDDYNKFCEVIETALGFTGIAFLSLSAGTGLDLYVNYVH